MRKNIFIRMLCLLLCVSMLLPAEAAASSLLYEYPTRSPQYTIGEKTNEMAYVDQLFTSSGSTQNGRRIALNRWLSNEKADGDHRTNSGYLMLDEEVARNSSHHLDNGELEKNSEANWHMFNEFNVRFLGPVAEYFASGGASVVISFGEDLLYRHKFNGAGKSALPYFTQLCQIFYEYYTDLQNELNEVDKTFEYLAKSVESIAKFPNDEIAIKTQNNIWFFRGKGKSRGLHYDIVDVVDMNQLRVKVERNINGKIETQETTLAKLVQSPGNVNEVIAVTNKVKNEELRNLLDTEINNRVKAYTTKKGNTKEELFGLSYEHINGVASTIDESDLDDELKAEWKKISDENVEYVDISEDLKSIQDFGKKLGVINGTIQTFNSLVNVTAQQSCYMNVLTNVSKDYLGMLDQWHKDVKAYEVPFGYGHVQRDILAAIEALMRDVMDLQEAASKNLVETAASDKAFGMAVLYNAGEFAKIILDIMELAGWKGLEKFADLTTNISGNQKTSARISGAAAIFSMAWNMASASFLEFEDKASTIYNLKYSLDELLRNKESGLLAQYAEERTHEKACEIIRALDTMKILKLMGENLIEEYYLCDFYDSQGVNISSAAHLVLRNEMAKRTGNGRLDASGSIAPIIGVYKDYVHKFPNWQLTIQDDFHLGTVFHEFVGYYVKDSSKNVYYDGTILKELPFHYKGISNHIPDYGDVYYEYPIQYKDDRETSVVLYKDDKMGLYSSNGVEVILSGEAYDLYMELENEINRLLNKYDDVNDIFWRKWEQQDHSKKEEDRIEKEQECHDRLQWTITTRGWIESFEMFDPNTNYFTHEVEYVPVF